MEIILVIIVLVGGIAMPIYISSMKAFEREINSNIKYLQQTKWCQAYDHDDVSHPLIHKNKRVRRIIGLMNVKKMSQPNYNEKQRQKIEKEIQRQANK